MTNEQLHSEDVVLENNLVERNSAEDQLFPISRLYRVLNRINETIIHSTDREEIFAEACRTAVEEGHFIMAWIGVIDPVSLLIRPVASYGDKESYVQSIRVSVKKDEPEGQGPIGEAIRERRPYICNDFLNDPRMSLWRKQWEKCGFRSGAAFPVHSKENAIGIMAFYSGEAEFFNEEEVGLIGKIVSNISFAITALDIGIERKQAYEEIKLLHVLSMAVNQAEDFNSALKAAVRMICDMTGWAFGEVWLPSADGSVFEFGAEYCISNSSTEFIEFSRKFRFKPGEGLPGRVWLSKRPEWLQDIPSAGDIFPRGEGAITEGILAGFGVPIVGHEKVLAVLEFFMTEQSEKDKRLIDTVSAISAQLGNLFLRKLSEERLLQSNTLLKAISIAQSEFISEVDANMIFDGLLRNILDLTHSEYGFIGEIFYEGDGTPYLKSHAITNIAWNDETRELYDKCAPSMEFRNLKSLFGEVITTGKPVISNNPSEDPRRCGIPKGHPPLNAFLGLPFYIGEKLVGMVGMANSPGGYNSSLIEYLQPFLSTCANIINAYRIKRQHREAIEERFAVQRRYEELINNLPIGVYRNTPGKEGHFIEVNPALITMIEADSREELFSRNASDFYEDKKRRLEISEKILKDGFIENEEMEIVTLKGNKIWVCFSSVARKDYEGNVYFDGVVENITERKRLEQQLLHSQRMEAVGQLAGGIAHDFNNALTAIIGFAKLLLMKKGDDRLVNDYVQHIVDAGESAASLVQGILAFSRKQTTIIQPVDIAVLIHDVENIILRLIGEDIELKTTIQDGPLIVKADPGQIGHILMNLATNARDAMPEGGRITISTELVEVGEGFINEDGYCVPGSYAMISFSDTGTGMDEETQKKIFEPFFTTKEVGKGTGLGLAMVYGIVKQHDGFINVNSKLGEGTTFKIYLPVAGHVHLSEKNAEDHIPQGGTETILLVEDDENVRRITLSVLEDFGYDVIVAVNGEDAISKFKENKEKIRLCVSDMVMPRMGGLEAFEKIKEIKPDIKVLFMSGYAGEKIDGIIDERLDFISKPASPSEFLRKVREVLNR